jgi:alpha-1,3-rhamnosyl/mannosyltransferase
VSPRFRPTPADPGWLRRRFDVGGRYVLCVGNREPRKNLAAAVRAFAAAGAADCSLVVAGVRGWRNAEFERAVERTGAHVAIAGYVSDDDLVRLYSGAACLVFPSLYEGFGLPPLEAMACGTPVIASDRTSLPEVVGDAGVLVDPRDEDALAAAIAALLEDESRARELGERGRERAARFTWERAADATVAAYREALA